MVLPFRSLMTLLMATVAFGQLQQRMAQAPAAPPPAAYRLLRYPYVRIGGDGVQFLRHAEWQCPEPGKPCPGRAYPRGSIYGGVRYLRPYPRPTLLDLREVSPNGTFTAPLITQPNGRNTFPLTITRYSGIPFTR